MVNKGRQMKKRRSVTGGTKQDADGLEERGERECERCFKRKLQVPRKVQLAKYVIAQDSYYLLSSGLLLFIIFYFQDFCYLVFFIFRIFIIYHFLFLGLLLFIIFYF